MDGDVNHVRNLDRRAVAASVDLAAGATVVDLRRPTPCAGWTLDDLLAHMTAQHRGFTAAAQGRGGDPEPWAVAATSADRVGDHQRAAAEVVTAFAAEGVPDRTFTLPEFPPPGTFPAATAIGFHFVDYLVHAWDVAVARGLDWWPADDLAEAGLALARRVPNGPERDRPGAPFAPGPATDPNARAFTQVLTLLGRSPTWPSGLPG
jgi:uncharacterized protein (TIGR03086 family)